MYYSVGIGCDLVGRTISRNGAWNQIRAQQIVVAPQHGSALGFGRPDENRTLQREPRTNFFSFVLLRLFLAAPESSLSPVHVKRTRGRSEWPLDGHIARARPVVTGSRRFRNAAARADDGVREFPNRAVEPRTTAFSAVRKRSRDVVGRRETAKNFDVVASPRALEFRL
jgi:hypothetical protein